MGAVHTYVGLPACVLHNRAAYLEGRGAIDLLLDSVGASSWVGFRQFGMKQPVPLVVNTSTDLHKISLQGKWEKDWEAEHDVYIQQWANREHEVRAAPPLDGNDTYLVKYMKWYDRSTRRYIIVESAYWELTVSQQFLPLCWHHCLIKYLL